MNNLLFTSVGRRVELIKAFSCEAKKYEDESRIITADAGSLVPASFFSDLHFSVPSFMQNPDEYINNLLEICKTEKVKLIIPLHEREFYLLDKARAYFEEAGTMILLSSRYVLDICCDKYRTFNFFKYNGIPTIPTYEGENIEENTDYPLIIKPRCGMGSSGIYKAHNKEERDFFIGYSRQKVVVQEFMNGDEYSIDCLCDLNGNYVCGVPRRRIEVRNGEVSKSVTVEDKKIMEYVKNICNTLKPIGPLNIQCFKTDKGIYFNEINPRFGGGVPLAMKAGLNYPQFLFRMLDNKNPIPLEIKFEAGLHMLRYDESIFFSLEGGK